MSKSKLLLPVYVPTFLLSFGYGMLIPTLPLYIKEFGVSYVLVSLAIAALDLGTLSANIPVGILIDRIGRKPVMIIGTASLAVSSLALGIVSSFPLIILYRVISGFGSSMWSISRHAYMADVIPLSMRGRAFAAFGGINRIGSLAGPAIGGYIGFRYGLRAPFLVHGALAAITVLTSAIFIVEIKPKGFRKGRGWHWYHFISLLKGHWRALASAGSAQIFAQMIRSGREIIIPLYGADVIGLDVKQIGSIMSISKFFDMTMFYPAGLVMDRLGRRYTSIPCFLIMGVGMSAIPFSQNFLGFLIAATVIGLGNGIGSGSMMTLGADLAPKEATGEFLGIWRFIGDVGGGGGPMIVGSMADLYGLHFAAFSMSGVGFIAAAVLFLFVKETLDSEIETREAEM